MTNQAPPRILFVVQSMVAGGMEEHAIEVAAEFVERGFRVAAVVSTDELAHRFTAAGAEAGVLVTDACGGRLAQLRGGWRLLRLLRSWRPDVVHLDTGGSTGGLLVVALARLATGAAVVHTEHDVPSEPQTAASVLNGVPTPRAAPMPDPDLRRSTRALLGIALGAVIVGSLVRIAPGRASHT